MSQRLVTLRQMQTGVGVITALSLGVTVPGVERAGSAPDAERVGKQAPLVLDQVDNVRQIFTR